MRSTVSEIYLKCTLHVSDRSTVHHQEYLNTIYMQRVFVMLVLLVSASVVRMERQQNYHDKYLLHVYSTEILLKMDSGPVRNM